MPELGDESVTLRQWLDVVRRARLGRTAKAVALMLATYADNDGSRVYPGVARLAVDCELTYNVIQTALKRLREAGLIAVVRKGARRGQADEYRLILASDILDRIDVLTPAHVTESSAVLAARRRGRHKPPAATAPSRPPHRPRPTPRDADDLDPPALHPDPWDAGWGAQHTAAPHGNPRSAAAAPHGGRHLHLMPSPPTTHGPNHNCDHPIDNAVRSDVAAVAADAAAAPADGDPSRCAHGLGGNSGIRCPACRRGLGSAASAASAGEARRPLLRLVHAGPAVAECATPAIAARRDPPVRLPSAAASAVTTYPLPAQGRDLGNVPAP
ncbi:helix-turn-helix domain-containing protein [Dactylosporangium sp. CS-047395]|uniref:helix-turn-helix domain-containing protein n=1 Tax=Dactylosporangium sp. CS-047395 TaxID=3239936 RepID=UPI003D93BC45